LDKLVNSVDRKNLQTVIAELGKSFDHTGPDLQRLIDQGNNLLVSAQAALPQTLRLINDGRTVLQTQRDVSGDFLSFSHNLNLLSQQFVVSDPDVRKLFDNGVASAQTLQGVISENSGDLGALTANLVTLGQINLARLPGIEQTLILYPLNVANGFLGARGGIAQFGAVTTSAPPDCTSGYQSTKHRSERAGNPSFGLGGPANLNTLCQGPNQAGQGGQSEARGSALAPRPPGDTTATRGGAVGTTASNSQPTYAFAGYDNQGRFAGPNGKAYSLGNAGAQSQAFGPTSWQYLLAANAVN
jgi:phospholipid/cholesterol/gamma-HCH transport system substrate-binding protein